MKFTLKPGVRLLGMRPELMIAILAAYSIYDDHGYNCTVTSVVDGQHSYGSAHFTGEGVDIRTRNVPGDELQVIRKEIAKALGKEFDVVLESDHLHIEYDPKKGTHA